MQVKLKNVKKLANDNKKTIRGTQMKLIEEIKLDNGLKLKIYDLSRSIALDTVKVELSFKTKIPLKKSFFQKNQDYIQVKNIMGNQLTYEHKLKRSFVPKENEDSTRNDLINTFKNNSLGYLSSVNFPKKMALSALRNIKNNPYKYQCRANPDKQS
ncbi:MAG: hypothetical protein JW976_03040 [Syntrophaceae bacterium]|nr:hypothetical protein [Syntrophaceae bacterium]